MGCINCPRMGAGDRAERTCEVDQALKGGGLISPRRQPYRIQHKAAHARNQSRNLLSAPAALAHLLQEMDRR